MDKQRIEELRKLVTQGKNKEVFELLNSLILIDPCDVFALLNLSIIMLDQGKVEEAIKVEKRALKIDPNCIGQFKEHSIFPEDSYKLSSVSLVWLSEALKDAE
jgi:tetratricopeptide (TPR) repeat protein